MYYSFDKKNDDSQKRHDQIPASARIIERTDNATARDLERTIIRGSEEVPKPDKENHE
jgi:hypothetical protein